MVTIDGTDLPVQHRFDPKFSSHKFKSNGLKYEVGVCIQSGNIVWVNGPFCGGESGITIARQAVIGTLDEDEMVEADGGYSGEDFYVKIPKNATTDEQRHIKTITRPCHKTANNLLKIFGILRQKFRHGLEKHSMSSELLQILHSSASSMDTHFTKLSILSIRMFFSVAIIEFVDDK